MPPPTRPPGDDPARLEPIAGELHRHTWRDVVARVLAVVALFVAGGSLVVSVSVDTDGAGPAPARDVTFKVNEGAGDGKGTATVKVAAPVVAQAAAGLETRLADETPPLAEQAAPGELTAAQQAAARVKATQDPLPTAGASAGFRGCVTRFVRNQSSRRGVRPQLQVLHYTVSPNRAGWSDVNAVVALFDRSSSQASSTFVIDAEGHCAYIVPIEAKAWTQAAGNPLSVSYEVINSGREAAFMATAGYARLRDVMRQVSARTGIPMRAGSVYPLRAGIVQHKDGGLAWGGHVDVTPFAKGQIIRVLVAAPSSAPNTALERARCGALRHHRRAVHAGARWSDVVVVRGRRESRGRRARYLKGALRRAHVVEARYCI
jgi:hypothetical protein